MQTAHSNKYCRNIRGKNFKLTLQLVLHVRWKTRINSSNLFSEMHGFEWFIWDMAGALIFSLHLASKFAKSAILIGAASCTWCFSDGYPYEWVRRFRLLCSTAPSHLKLNRFSLWHTRSHAKIWSIQRFAMNAKRQIYLQFTSSIYLSELHIT